MRKEKRQTDVKRRMAEALKNQMRTKELDKIKVGEIIKECNIARATFYYHFQDIYDLLRWMLGEEKKKILAREESDWKEAVLNFLKYIQENRKLCMNAANLTGRKILEDFFYELVYHFVCLLIQDEAQDMPIEEVYIRFLSEYYTTSLSACVLKWMESQSKISPEQMVKMFEIILDGSVRNAVDKIEKQNKIVLT